MKTCIKKCTGIQILFGIILLGLVAATFVYFIPTKSTEGGNDVEISFLIYIATMALGVIAYIELSRSHKLNTIELLTFISNRWSSSEIIIARQLVHSLFVFNYRHDIIRNRENDYVIAMRNTSIDVLLMSRKIKKEGKDFIYLLNLLDHFESISYFYFIGEISLADIKNIYGNNMAFYYQALEDYIKNRQKHKPLDFSNYSKMYVELKLKKTSEKEGVKS